MNRLILFIFFLPVPGIGQSTNISSKADLTTIYSQAISDFIRAVKKKHKTSFDTLYFGKHVYGQPDDFPDIELPETIENTQIRLISPENGMKMQKARKSLVYINMIGWVEQRKAEFIFVTFSNGSEHQYDCFINYKYDAGQKKFELKELQFKYYLYQNNP